MSEHAKIKNMDNIGDLHEKPEVAKNHEEVRVYYK